MQSHLMADLHFFSLQTLVFICLRMYFQARRLLAILLIAKMFLFSKVNVTKGLPAVIKCLVGELFCFCFCGQCLYDGRIYQPMDVESKLWCSVSISAT